MVSKNKSLKTIRIRKYFIEATEQVIRNGGIESVTIRKVSDIAGYNSATLYNYFDGLEHLILYASLKFFKPYFRELSMLNTTDMNPVERYVKTFRLFAFHSFSNPSIFFNFFYGKYGKTIDKILAEYYEMYPEEIKPFLDNTTQMLLKGDIFERERIITNPIYTEGYITKEEQDRLVEISVWSHECLLNQMCQPNNEIGVEEQCNTYERMMVFLLKKLLRKDLDKLDILKEIDAKTV